MRVELSRWCRAVGAPVFVAAAGAPGRTLRRSMNWWWCRGTRISPKASSTLIAQAASPAHLTGGRPVAHFVLLVQELYRRGDDVPAFDVARSIGVRDPAARSEALDIDDHAAALGLSMLYVPSMRNGPELREDRGNAIISTEPLLDPFALELPLARQRRVALGAAISVQTADGPQRLQVVDAHLEPLSSPKTLWVFKNPRAGQVQAILDLLETPRFTDRLAAGRRRARRRFQHGAFRRRRRGVSPRARLVERLVREDARDTHMMGRLDYLFFRLGDGWTASTRRLDERFGSDHYPVIGTFSR